MSTKITYQDKVAIQNDPEVPEINKVTDEDMNNIKNAVNANADELDETKKTAEENKGKIDEIENYNSTELTEKLKSIEQKNAEQDTSISQNETDISNLKQKDIEKDEEIEGLKAKDNELNTTIIDLKDKAGNKLSLEIDPVNYITTLKLLNQDDVELDSKQIDFPLESVVVNGRYEDGNVVLTLQNETEITIPIGEIINGLVSQETFDNAVKELQGKIDECVKTTEFQKSQSTQDQRIENLENDVKKKIEEYLALIEKSANTVSGVGEDVTLSGTVDSRFKKFEVGGNSIQDGEPSPDNAVPIRNVEGNANISVCNKNLLNIDTTTKYNCRNQGDGSLISNISNSYFCGLTLNNFSNLIMRNLGKYLTFSTDKAIQGKQMSIVLSCKRSDKPNSSVYEVTSTSKNIVTMKIPKTTTEVSSLELRWNRDVTRFTDTTTVFKDFQLTLSENEETETYAPHQQQSKTFPLEQGQVLHKGDYLAEDGIHQVRNTVKFDGTENWIKWVAPSKNYGYYCSTGVPALITTTSEIPKHQLCSHFKCNVKTHSGEVGCYVDGGGSACFTTEIATVEEWKEYLAQENSKGTPVTIEYETKEKLEIIPYTPAQQKAYDEIMQMTSYEDTTHVFSEDEISPIFNVTAYAKGTNTVQEQTVQSEPTIEQPTYDNQMETPSYEEDTEDEEVE